MKTRFASSLLVVTCALASCAGPSSTPRTGNAAKPAPAKPAPPATVPSAEREGPAEKLAADTPKTTVQGNTFIAPAGWSIRVRGPSTILEAPERGSRVALIDVRASTAEEAVAKAWAACQPDAKRPVKVIKKAADRDGWTDRQTWEYQASPNEHRLVQVSIRRAGELWNVAVYDMDQAVGEKRLAQVELIFGQLFPKGYQRETFAGRQPHRLDPTRLAALEEFVEVAMRELRVPGVSLGLVQDGEVVALKGFGVRELGGKQKTDADTLFMVASNTKALTTLMLAKLVDSKKVSWETPVNTLLPSFKLGDQDTTGRVLVKHLICACTGLPRQDLEWALEFKGLTPDGALTRLAKMKPTSKFGELFQYSNLMAAAAGFAGGHVEHPKLELGAAYDRAMSGLVFTPLGMKATTFDFARALRANHATPHAPDVEGRPARAVMERKYALIPVRPAGGAWSSARDMIAYVKMELAEGALPNGKRYISREALLARRSAQVAIGKDASYGMGLVVDRTHGVPVVHHGGDASGFHSDMIWLPEQNVGAVVLTNSAPGWILCNAFSRKLLEVLFDGRPEADAQVVARGKAFFAQHAAERKAMSVPADEAEAKKLAQRYRSDALGEITVSRKDGVTSFDFGEWKSEVGSKRNPDGSLSFVTIGPGTLGAEFVVGAGTPRTLVIRDAQHEYVFTEK